MSTNQISCEHSAHSDFNKFDAGAFSVCIPTVIPFVNHKIDHIFFVCVYVHLHVWCSYMEIAHFIIQHITFCFST